jgi:hypothetical protein
VTKRFPFSHIPVDGLNYSFPFGRLTLLLPSGRRPFRLAITVNFLLEALCTDGEVERIFAKEADLFYGSGALARLGSCLRRGVARDKLVSHSEQIPQHIVIDTGETNQHAVITDVVVRP